MSRRRTSRPKVTRAFVERERQRERSVGLDHDDPAARWLEAAERAESADTITDPLDK